MDLDEWELIPDDGLPKIHDDGGQKTISRTYVKNSSKSVFNNYLEIPSSESQKFVESTNVPRLSKQLVPLPDELQPNIHKTPDQELVQEVIIQADNVIRLAPNIITEKIKSPSAFKVDQDSVSQVFFKKMEENDFVIDMKLDSPKSSSRGIVPRIEANKFQCKEKTDNHQTIETMIEIEKEKEDDADGVSMWKWSLTGIGAICSCGVAAAICIIILGNGQQRRKLQHNHQKLQFQFHADDKRIKEAMSAARGIPLARAQITYGGYYEGF